MADDNTKQLIGDGDSNPLETAKATVEHLYHFRDHYFEIHGLDQANEKPEKLKKLMTECVETLETLRDKIENKSLFHMYRGQALNVLPAYDSQAAEALSKSVKLDPQQLDAWNHLGECYWKNGDIQSAKNCFNGALTHSKNKVSLRNLSMVLRQLKGTIAERVKFIEESVEKAKAAIELDLRDGMSWLILGNAYLSKFFACGQNPKSLRLCMSAYVQAEKDPVANNNADLHFNKSTAHKYQEEYQLALTGFSQAAKLDPSFTDPMETGQRLIDHLLNVQDLWITKGKMKSKRLKTLVQSMKDTDLGPYKGGSYTSPTGKTINLVQKLVCDLVANVNPGSVVLGKVVCTVVTAEEPIPFTFCMIDEKETCIPVTIYNMAQGIGVKIGDSVAVPEPFLQTVDVDHFDKKVSYSSIRVDTPIVLVVNGRKLGLDKQAPTTLSVSTFSE